jgi:hypothetical protein
MLARFVDRDSRRGKRGVCKSSYRYHDFVFEAFDLVVHGGSAIRAEVKHDSVAFITYAKILLRPPFDLNRVGAKARLGTKYTACPPLAGKAVADGHSNRLLSYGKRELTATA